MLPEAPSAHTLAPAESAFHFRALHVIPWLDSKSPFPPVESALAEPNGLLAAGGDLSPARLIEAYRHGIYPWYSRGQPLLWWSPDPRMVLYVDEFKLSRSLAKRIRRGDFDVRVDTAFDDVLHACQGSVCPPMGARSSERATSIQARMRRIGPRRRAPSVRFERLRHRGRRTKRGTPSQCLRSRRATRSALTQADAPSRSDREHTAATTQPS